MKFHLVLASGNSKTGPIPVSTTSSDTCPSDCPLQGKGCYAEHGPLGFHWNKVNRGERGLDFASFIELVSALPRRQLWRHNQAGDLPGLDNRIDAEMLRTLVAANRGKNGFTYTHKPMTKENMALVKESVRAGFTINLSADHLEDADELAELCIAPVVVVLPHDAPQTQRTPAGRTVIVCPAQIDDANMNCARCGLCAIAGRKSIVGFKAHGTRARRVSIMAANKKETA